MENLIPELSFKDIEKGDSNSIGQLKSALSNHGFFSITDHGLSKSLVNDCYKSSKDFFNLDFDVKNKIFYDVIYNPGETNFLKMGKDLGNRTENGKYMFIYQAHQAFTIWHKLMPEINDEVVNIVTND